jgi:hypothetical protein
MAIDITGKVGWFSGVVGPDADALAFISAANITNTTQQNAIIKLVTDLKGYGVWTKMKALYPFVGGNASAHKFNLKDPRDLDAAYRLVFAGGWTHSSTGALPNGTTGYADTKLAPYSVMSNQQSVHISFYSNTNSFPTVNGTIKSNGGYSLNPDARGLGVGYWKKGSGVNAYYASIGSISEIIVDTTTPTSQGFILASRTSSTSAKLYQNSTILGLNNITSTGALPTLNMYIGARNGNGTIEQYHNLNQQFASIGEGLTDTEATNYYTAVQTFQTTLGRQV